MNKPQEELTTEIVEEIVRRAVTHVDILRRNDSLKGGIGYPRAAFEIEQFALIFKDGFNKRIPRALKRYYIEIQNERDPEYLKYLELKRKFEGK